MDRPETHLLASSLLNTCAPPADCSIFSRQPSCVARVTRRVAHHPAAPTNPRNNRYQQNGENTSQQVAHSTPKPLLHRLCRRIDLLTCLGHGLPEPPHRRVEPVSLVSGCNREHTDDPISDGSRNPVRHPLSQDIQPGFVECRQCRPIALLMLANHRFGKLDRRLAASKRVAMLRHECLCRFGCLCPNIIKAPLARFTYAIWHCLIQPRIVFEHREH